MMGRILNRVADVRRQYALAHGRDVNLSELARSVGVTRAAMSRIERNESGISTPVLTELCRFLGVQPGDLLIYVEDEPVEVEGVEGSAQQG